VGASGHKLNINKKEEAPLNVFVNCGAVKNFTVGETKNATGMWLI